MHVSRGTGSEETSQGEVELVPSENDRLARTSFHNYSPMTRKYLDFPWGYNFSVDVIMSIRSTNESALFARRFYNAWLEYWPINVLGSFIFMTEPFIKFLN